MARRSVSDGLGVDDALLEGVDGGVMVGSGHGGQVFSFGLCGNPGTPYLFRIPESGCNAPAELAR